MINLELLRESPEHIIAAIKKKDPLYDGYLLYDLDASVRALRTEIDLLRHDKNEIAKQAQHGITQELRERSLRLGKELKEKEEQLKEVEGAFNKLYLYCPNIPLNDVPEGNKEANVVIKEVGKKALFNFEVKNHVELGAQLGWFDFEAAAKMSASNFAFYKGQSVYLMYALTMFMLKNNIKHGFSPVIPPYLINEESLVAASNFPRFKDQVYEVSQDALYLTPTAEVNLANIYRNHIFALNELPVRMTAWTSCFRREAGNYGAAERGLIRIHQFEKVELYTICEPATSAQELERMLVCAEDILNQLGLHYRISLLAGQDCSFASAKTYDIEVWMPGQNKYMEVSSCSNCEDFQARRGMMRFRTQPNSKTQFVHTLNGSSLALPRLIVAIMETFQQRDGSVAIPDVLKKEALFVP